MNIYNRKLGKKHLVLILIFYTVLFGIVLSSSNFNLNYDNSQDNGNQYKNDKIYPNIPQLNDYSSNSEGNGGDINVTLHQSLYDTTRKEILNTSDPSQNSFTVAAPPDSDFNSTYTYIEVEDLYAPNKTIVIQEYNDTKTEIIITAGQKILASTFTIDQDMYLENVLIKSKSSSR